MSFPRVMVPPPLKKPRRRVQCRPLRTESAKKSPKIIDLWMGLSRGTVFRHGGGVRKQPIKQPTQMPTSTMALVGRLPSLMSCFLTLMARFPDFVLRGRFTSWTSTGNSQLRKGASSEPFAIGPVQFSWPRRVAENWFTKPGFWDHFVSFS